MGTRVITERLLVRMARGEDRPTGCAEDELSRLCERRDRLVSELEQVEDRMRRVWHRNGPVTAA
ncbi:MAG: hypothetical protein ACM3S1_09880 [Hyphomicrobiales bacterium]